MKIVSFSLTGGESGGESGGDRCVGIETSIGGISLSVVMLVILGIPSEQGSEYSRTSKKLLGDSLTVDDTTPRSRYYLAERVRSPREPRRFSPSMTSGFLHGVFSIRWQTNLCCLGFIRSVVYRKLLIRTRSNLFSLIYPRSLFSLMNHRVSFNLAWRCH